MECSRIPPAVLWDQATSQQLQQYQSHVKACKACRRKILHKSPELLLQELSSSPLPDEFWFGFWDSLKKKIGTQEKQPQVWFRITRWAAVFVFVLMLGYSGEQGFEDPGISGTGANDFSDDIPIVEDIRNSPVTYYVFQGAGGEKVVLLFDSEIEL